MYDLISTLLPVNVWPRLSDRYEIVWRIYSQMRGWRTFRNVKRGSCGQRIISVSGHLPLRVTKTLRIRRVYIRASNNRVIVNFCLHFFFFVNGDRQWLWLNVRVHGLFRRFGPLNRNIYDELWNLYIYFLAAFFTFFARFMSIRHVISVSVNAITVKFYHVIAACNVFISSISRLIATEKKNDDQIVSCQYLNMYKEYTIKTLYSDFVSNYLIDEN